MTQFIRVHYLPWHSALFVTIASLGFAFGSLTCLVLSASKEKKEPDSSLRI